MKKHKIKIYHKDKQMHVALLEYRNLLNLIFWWSVKLHRSGTAADVEHYKHAWVMEFGLTDDDVQKEGVKL